MCRQTPTQGRGESPTPVPVDVLDHLPGIVADADMAADLVAQAAGVDALPHAAHAYADPRPFLHHAARWLPRAAEAEQTILDEIGPLAADMLATCRSLLGVTDTVQWLAAACPWCRVKALRVRRVGTEPLVVCEAWDVPCEPPASDVGRWWRGRPAWIEPEWPWLVQRIEHADARDTPEAS